MYRPSGMPTIASLRHGSACWTARGLCASGSAWARKGTPPYEQTLDYPHDDRTRVSSMSQATRFFPISVTIFLAHSSPTAEPAARKLRLLICSADLFFVPDIRLWLSAEITSLQKWPEKGNHS